MKSSYGLLNGLFSSPIKSAAFDDNTKKSSTTQRTWKIRDELWEDFTTLVAVSGMTQAEYVNKLIEEEIERGGEKIAKYREVVGK